jgi:hypothetical protein
MRRDFHALRHSYLTLITLGGAQPKIAQPLARHSDINLTMGSYTHTRLTDEAAALQVLPELPSVFERKEDQGPPCDLLTNCLPSCLPAHGAIEGNSVHLGTIGEGDQTLLLGADDGTEKAPKPLKTKDFQGTSNSSARGGTRTPKGFLPLDPKSSASANSATLAFAGRRREF